MRSGADAEDLTQLTFERALRSWSRYDPSRASVATWLLVIARNLLVDHLRADRSARRQPLDELDGGHGALKGGSGNDTISARDRKRDTINCGAGRDRAVVDRIDRVARNCERVVRR